MKKNIYLNASVIFFLMILFIAGCSQKEETVPVAEIRPNPFSLAIDNLIEVRDTIEYGETLSDILTPHSVSMQKIHEIEKIALNVFPLREFRAGKELYIYASWDTVETVKYIVYVIDEINHVVFDLRDTTKIYKSQKPFTVKQVHTKGIIKKGLIQDLTEMGIDPNIAFTTADVFESRIDFGMLQENDSFDVIYDEIFVDDKPVQVGKVYAAKMNHRKKDYYAFLFEKEKPNSYYDEKGESMIGMFLTAPIKFRYRISSRFSGKRFHPVLKRNKAHLGTDYAAAHGTPIQSVAHGTVLEAAYTSGNGNYVKIKHNATYTTQYLHMSRFAKGIKRGAKVTQGQIIGYVGSTGLATGPHVCFRFWKNGRQVDPLRERGHASIPLSPKFKPEFEQIKNEWIEKLSKEI